MEEALLRRRQDPWRKPDSGGGKVRGRSLASVEVKFMEKASLWRRQGSRRKTYSAGGEVHGGSFAPPEVGHPEELLEMTHSDVGYIGYRHENKKTYKWSL